MSIELIRDVINYEKLVGEGTSQTMVNGDIVVGERNPEIGKILKVDGKTYIVSSEVVEDKIIAEGKMDFEIFYSTTEGDTRIYKMGAVTNFTHNIQVPGADSKMPCKLIASIEHIDYDNDLSSNRKVKVNAVINLKGMVYEKDTAETVMDIKGNDVQILKDSTLIDEYIGENSNQAIIKGKIEIPENMPEVESIVNSNIHIHKKDISVQDGKVVVNACALMRVMYDSPASTTQYIEQDVAFTNEIEIPEINPNMKCDVSFKIGQVYEEIKENENVEKRVLEIEVVIDVYAKLYLNREVVSIVDAYSPHERYDIRKNNITTIGFFGEGTDSQTIKERMAADDEGIIGDIKYATITPTVTDAKIVEDKVIIEGLVDCCMMYSTPGEEPSIASATEEYPFKSTIDMPGAKIDMIPEIEVNIEHMAYDKANDKEIDVKVMLECAAKVYYKNPIEIIREIEETDVPENVKNMPSIVIYVVQPQDSLWKIAKKYSTTVEDIVKMNEIEDPENIKAGIKLLIPKKMFMK